MSGLPYSALLAVLSYNVNFLLGKIPVGGPSKGVIRGGLSAEHVSLKVLVLSLEAISMRAPLAVA